MGPWADAIAAFKLWYAGRSKNWKLADYEIEQIRKSFESIKVF